MYEQWREPGKGAGILMVSWGLGNLSSSLCESEQEGLSWPTAPQHVSFAMEGLGQLHTEGQGWK